MKLSVLDISGKETGKQVTLSDAVFGIEPNEHVMYLDVKQHLGNKRQGTHKAKERAEISGSTRKIKKQKGTGTARAGSIKSPIFRGGGRVFGPRPRSYRSKMNKNMKRLAKRSALSQKAKEDKLLILDEMNFDVPKTQKYVGVLEALKISDKKTLFVLDEPNKNVYLSARNFKNSKVVTASELNTYSILNADKIVFLEGSLEGIESILNK